METGQGSDQFGHILVQLTVCLRNICDVGGMRLQFLALDVIEDLCRLMEIYPTDADLMLNVSRIFRYGEKVILQKL